MNIMDHVQCKDFPCTDVRHECYAVPNLELDPEGITMVMISEAAPPDPNDYFTAGPRAQFLQTTLQAFADAGIKAATIEDLLARGVYLTTAVKCAKTGYAIAKETVETCSHLLEMELALFPNTRVYMLMGDIAIKAIHTIAKRKGQPRPIPAGATYKIRGGEFHFQGKRIFPSYLQAGPSFFIEKSKRRMIAEDITRALATISYGS